MSDVPSTELTFLGLGSPDKTLMRFGKSNGHVADYGHCDLVWSRYARRKIFPRSSTGSTSVNRASALHHKASVRFANSRCQPVPKTESMQICDQVSNSTRRLATVDIGRNSASASPSSQAKPRISSSKRWMTPR